MAFFIGIIYTFASDGERMELMRPLKNNNECP